MGYTNSNMANKKSKKRTKRYQGEDAKTATSTSEPIVHRYEAVERNALQQWWHEKKRVVKTSAYIGGGLLFFGWLIFELLQVIL